MITAYFRIRTRLYEAGGKAKESDYLLSSLETYVALL
jgi:hypothetical protein